MQDHSHRNDVSPGQRILKEITGCNVDTILQFRRGNVFFRHGFDRRQIEAGTLNLWMLPRDFYGEQSSCTADVTEGVIAGKIEFLGQRLEVDSGQASHAVEELFEFRRLGIQLFEDAFSAVLGFVLRLPGAKRFRQVMPELEQPCVQHLGDSADVARALAVKVERAAAGVLEYFASAP